MGMLRSIGRFLSGLFKRQPRGGSVEPSAEVELESELKRGMRGD